MNVRWFILQRATAAIMAPLVLLHLGLIFYASGHALSAAEILGRTRGSLLWAAMYATFVIAASVHAAIGLHGVLREWTTLRGRPLDIVAAVLFVVLIALGLMAVAAVTLPLHLPPSPTQAPP